MVVYLLCHKHAIVWRVVPPVTRAWHWWVHASTWTHQPPQLSRCTCPATSRRKRPTWDICGKKLDESWNICYFFSIIKGRLQNARNWNHLHVDDFKPDLRPKSSTCRWFDIFFWVKSSTCRWFNISFEVKSSTCRWFHLFFRTQTIYM